MLRRGEFGESDAAFADAESLSPRALRLLYASLWRHPALAGAGLLRHAVVECARPPVAAPTRGSARPPPLDVFH